MKFYIKSSKQPIDTGKDPIDNVEACDTIKASMEFYIDHGAGLGKPGDKFTEDELKELYYHLCIHEGDEICNSYPSFEAWLDDSLASGLISVDFIEDDVDYPYTLTDDEFDVESEYFEDIESCDSITASQKHHPLIPEGWESIPEGEDDEGNWGTIAKELPNNDGYIWIDMYQDEAGKTLYHIDISYRTSEGRMGDVHPLTPKEFRSLKQALNFVEAKIARMYESEEDVEACDKVMASKGDEDRFDKIVSKILEFWETQPEPTSGMAYYDYLAQSGIENVDSDEFNRAWDKACEIAGVIPEDDGPVVLSDGMKIKDKEQAYIWLQENIEQYGNTYFWDSSLKRDLNKLIERFGNTYFWRS